jgi:16S rRNA (guanine527-N7)-methyltransferase
MSFRGDSFLEEIPNALEVMNVVYTDSQITQLQIFSADFFKWNAIHNLSAINDYEEFLTVHLLDSLSVINPILEKVRLGYIPEDANIADLGTGGGFPGMLLAIFLPNIQFYLVEAVKKKTAFLEHMKGRLKFKNVHIIDQRIEQFSKEQPKKMDATISRAFTELKNFIRYSEPLLKNKGLMMAMKSHKMSQELSAVSSDYKLISIEELKIPGLDHYRCLLTLEFMRKL